MRRTLALLVLAIFVSPFGLRSAQAQDDSRPATTNVPNAEYQRVHSDLGAGQALQIGLTHLDKFAYIGSFSGVLRAFDPKSAYSGVFSAPSAFEKKVRLLWFGAGIREDRFHQASKAALEALNRAGIKSMFFAAPFGHEWQTWRYDLSDFAPRLFRDN